MVTLVKECPQVCQVSHNLQIECDCSSCIQFEHYEDVGAFAITRAKGKGVLKWESRKKLDKELLIKLRSFKRIRNRIQVHINISL